MNGLLWLLALPVRIVVAIYDVIGGLSKAWYDKCEKEDKSHSAWAVIVPSCILAAYCFIGASKSVITAGAFLGIVTGSPAIIAMAGSAFINGYKGKIGDDIMSEPFSNVFGRLEMYLYGSIYIVPLIVLSIFY